MKLGAIMPLCVRGSYDVDDLTRSEILFRTLTVFAEPGMFDPFLVVVPPNEVELVQTRYGDKWQHLNVKVMSEEELVPELKNHKQMRGWRKQQIVKLAAPRVLKNDFYITFDADVICLKKLTVDKLIVDGKAVLQYEQRSLHPKWWKSSARILKMNPNVGDSDVGMSITPALMSTQLTANVGAEIQKIEGKNWVDALCSLHNPKHPNNWRISRYLKIKWTEYSLYYLCAHKLGLFDKYHVIAGTESVPQKLMIHDSHPFETWNSEFNFSDKCPGMFCVVGSKSFIEPHVVWERIATFLPSDSQEVV